MPTSYYRVLYHSSVSGILFEKGVFCQSSVLAFPITMDQDRNVKVIVDDWKIR